MKVIIIEDEPLMANELEFEVKKVDQSITIAGKFGSVKDTLNHLSRNGLPDLFFSDVQLTDGLSFEIFSQINSHVPVIFCTAFNDYALEAFKCNGVDYLLKPLASEEIKATIDKYQRRLHHQLRGNMFSQDVMGSSIRDLDSTNKSLIVHQGQKIFPVKYSDIRMLYLKNGITYLITNQGKKFMVNRSLDRMEETLGSGFYRANRQVLIHRDAIGYIDSYYARKLLITPLYKVDLDIVVSKANSPHFLSWLEAN